MKVQRTTVPIPTNILPAMIRRAKIDAERSGYKTLRAYLEALIEQGLANDENTTGAKKPTLSLAAAYPSSAWALGPAVLIHRTVRALEAVAERARAGDDVGTLERDLTALRREISEHLLTLRQDYDREVEDRDARHYGRMGGIE